jgi:hypothetical protein
MSDQREVDKMISSEKDLVKKENVSKLQLKKKYNTPQITVHGTIEEITKAKPGGIKDGFATKTS